MYYEYYTFHKEKINQKKDNHLTTWNIPTIQIEKAAEKIEGKNEKEIARLADRALLLLSFKDTTTLNLPHVLKVLGICTLKEKQSILQEIFRLIREGIVYIPRGLPQLIECGLNDPEELKNIDLCLLRPYDHLIQEIQDDIARLQLKYDNLEL